MVQVQSHGAYLVCYNEAEIVCGTIELRSRVFPLEIIEARVIDPGPSQEGAEKGFNEPCTSRLGIHDQKLLMVPPFLGINRPEFLGRYQFGENYSHVSDP